MKNKDNLYDIYKYDFHPVSQLTIFTEATRADGGSGEKNLPAAQAHFESLFDENTIGKLAKKRGNGDITLLPNDVIAKRDGIIAWRVNNSQMKKLWERDENKGGNGQPDKYEERAKESNPFCMVFIDNRPGRCLMAIQRSAAWDGKPDKLRDVLLENFNRKLEEKGLEMRIEALMCVMDFWDFINDRIYNHGDFVKKVEFTLQNPSRVCPAVGTDAKSEYVQSMLKMMKASNAVTGFFGMYFGEDRAANFSQENRDLRETVRLCAINGYGITVHLNEYRVYRINDFVRASFPLNPGCLGDFASGQLTLDAGTDLEQWFDYIIEETKSYVNESETPRKGNQRHA